MVRQRPMTLIRAGYRLGDTRDVDPDARGAPCIDALAQHPSTGRAEPASRPVNGSSSMINFGSCSSTSASANFWRMSDLDPGRQRAFRAVHHVRSARLADPRRDLASDAE
jgi:hypothetical protein